MSRTNSKLPIFIYLLIISVTIFQASFISCEENTDVIVVANEASEELNDENPSKQSQQISKYPP